MFIVRSKQEFAMSHYFRIFVLVLAIGLPHSVVAYQFPYSESLAEKDLVYSRVVGISDAKAYLRLGQVVLLMPGGERIEWKDQIRLKEYQKYLIEWRSTGDVITDAFEEYRSGFNEVMKREIAARNNKDAEKLIELIESEINAKIKLGTLKRMKGGTPTNIN